MSFLHEYLERDCDIFDAHSDAYNKEGARVRMNTVEIAEIAGEPHRKIMKAARDIITRYCDEDEEYRAAIADHTEIVGRVKALSLSRMDIEACASGMFKSLASYLPPDQIGKVMAAWLKKSIESQEPNPRPVATSIYLTTWNIAHVAGSSDVGLEWDSINAVEEMTGVPMSTEELSIAKRAKAEIEAKHVPLCGELMTMFHRLTNPSRFGV